MQSIFYYGVTCTTLESAFDCIVNIFDMMNDNSVLIKIKKFTYIYQLILMVLLNILLLQKR